MAATEYQIEMLTQRRQRRADRALFLARYVKIALIIAVIWTLRTDADLRKALMQTGSNVVAAISTPSKASGDRLPTSQVRVNRPAQPAQSAQIDAQAIARQVSTVLEAQKQDLQHY